LILEEFAMLKEIKTKFGYLVATMSLGLMLTACGDDPDSMNYHMQIQEGGRQVVSDNNASSFTNCGGGYGSEVRIEYAQSNINNSQSGYQNYPPNYQGGSGNYNGGTQWAPYNGAIQSNGHNYYDNPNQNYQNYGGGVRASIVIARSQGNGGQHGQQSGYTDPYYNNNYQNTNHNNQSGYYVAQLNVSGLQSQVSGSGCRISSFTDSSTVSGSIVCQGYQGNSGSVTINFSCQRRN
jgi:hypothetical protein